MSAQNATREYSVFNLDRSYSVARRVAVAGDSAARRRGLVGLERLEEGSGLWIAPCEAIHTFGMKIPIDAIFLDRKFQVKKLQSGLFPRRIAFCLSAYSVLEVEPGMIIRSGTRIGDRLTFQPAAVEAEADLCLQS